MSLSILITGATGFVGRQLVEQLKTHDVELFLLVRGLVHGFGASSNVNVIEHTSIESYSGKGLPDTIDVIIHLAAKAHVTEDDKRRHEYQSVNVNGTSALWRVARDKRVKHFIYLSSTKVYGIENTINAVTEQSPVTPKGVYAESKYQAEQILTNLTEDGIQVSIVRSPLIYGGGVKANMASLVKLVHLVPLLPLGMLHNKRSIVSVRNLCDFLKVLVFETPKITYKKEIFLVTDKYSYSTPELCKMIAQAFKKQVLLFPVPSFLISYVCFWAGKKSLWDKLSCSQEFEGKNPSKFYEWSAPFPTNNEIQVMISKGTQ